MKNLLATALVVLIALAGVSAQNSLKDKQKQQSTSGDLKIEKLEDKAGEKEKQVKADEDAAREERKNATDKADEKLEKLEDKMDKAADKAEEKIEKWEEKTNKHIGDGDDDHAEHEDDDDEHPGKGHAYGKYKGELSGKEFGKIRSEEAKLKMKKEVAEAEATIIKGEETLETATKRIKTAKDKVATQQQAGEITLIEAAEKEGKIEAAQREVEKLEEVLTQEKEKILGEIKRVE